MDKIINVGLSAFGMSGKLFHAPFFHAHPGFNLRSIVKRSEQSPESKYPATIILSDFEQLIIDPTIDLIVINTPIQLHFEHAKAAIIHGKNVLVEKPYTVTSAEARLLNQLAIENNVSLTVFQNRRFDRDYLAVKDILNNGQLGKIHEVEIRFDRFRPKAGGKLHKEADLPGSGALYDLGSHIIDQTLQLFGQPLSVYADLMIIREDVQSDDYFELILYYPDRLRVRLISNVMTKEIGPGYVIHGEHGSFIQKRSDEQESALLSGVNPHHEPWVPELNEPDGLLHALEGEIFGKTNTFSAPGNYMLFFDELYNYIAKNDVNPVTASDAIQTISLIEKAFESNQRKILVNL
ncbi:MAG: Gfo/Idh/MocA family oxidoreductase [Saprospiraceae bacterium]|nr:Gfo/Idh/MocA family oxidoreductase [Candidatus Brachybacter algidus]MBK8750029.1 Gfo/Idh/MocA family oxidoreductase [Candidatus Brachybacter algidus]